MKNRFFLITLVIVALGLLGLLVTSNVRAQDEDHRRPLPKRSLRRPRKHRRSHKHSLRRRWRASA